ncbi:MAG: hypothetical protein M1828_006875 [Chrysothrix sp. TS-e1954]|nr:MAG: hypothetical protein M1828_006875 [Chrysothrix sp. TS-e1954]
MAEEAKMDTATAKPTRPDEATFRDELERRKQITDQTRATMKDAQSKLNEARPDSKQPNGSSNLTTINAQLADLKLKQAGSKASRGTTVDKVKTLENQVRSKNAEIKAIKEKIAFKSTDDIDKEILRLNKQMDIGKLTLVEERKTAKDVSTLKTQKKQFLIVDQLETDIQSHKHTISELKNSMNSPEQKADQAQYEKLMKEKDEIYAAGKMHRNALDELRQRFNDARIAHDSAYAEMKSLQNEHYEAKHRYWEFDKDMKRARDQKRAADRQAVQQGRRKLLLTDKLIEAELPAFDLEIEACQRLLRINGASEEPKMTTAAPTTLDGPFTQRLVEGFNEPGLREAKKKDNQENYFVGGGGKKTKRKAKPRSNLLSASFNPGAMEDYTKVDVKQPSTEEEIPETIDQIRMQLKWYRDNSMVATKENVEKARKELEKFELQTGEAKPSEPDAATPSNGADRPVATGTTSPTTKSTDLPSSEPITLQVIIWLMDDRDIGIDVPIILLLRKLLFEYLPRIDQRLSAALGGHMIYHVHEHVKRVVAAEFHCSPTVPDDSPEWIWYSNRYLGGYAGPIFSGGPALQRLYEILEDEGPSPGAQRRQARKAREAADALFDVMNADNWFGISREIAARQSYWL